METLVERAERLGVATATVGEMLDELERLTDLNRVLEAGFMEAVKQIAKSDPVGVSRWLKEQGVTTPNVDVTGASGAFAAKRPCGQEG